MSQGHSHLTYEQRCQIYALNKRGITQNDVAKTIGVNQATISRELKRNSGKRGYRHKQAAKKAAKRRLNALKLRELKIRGFTKAFVEAHIKKKWSPDQIRGYLKKQYDIDISHESIYKYIYEDRKKGGELYKNLRRRGRKYQKRGSKKYAGRGYIKNRVDISERPKIVDKKTRFGDYEVDLIEGTKRGKAVLVTIVERKTKFLLVAKAPNKSSSSIKKAVLRIMNPLRAHLHTITSDNGKEFADHAIIAKKLNIDYFFAKPYSAWQRGLNEHVNGLIRQFYPKGTNFAIINAQNIQQVVRLINLRPRKTLNYFNPLEALTHEI